MSTAPPAQIFAIIPAAGRSRRMGQPKQLLQVDGRPMLLRVVDAALKADTASVTIVADRDVGEMIWRHFTTPDQERLRRSENRTKESEMIDSIRIALRELLDGGQVGASDGILVCPGDLPGLTPADFDACIAAFLASPQSIIVATHAGRGGHPLIFPAAVAEFVLSPACDGGLNALPRQHPSNVKRVERPTNAVTRDINTPQDLHPQS